VKVLREEILEPLRGIEGTDQNAVIVAKVEKLEQWVIPSGTAVHH
jgi:hypothetical protein